MEYVRKTAQFLLINAINHGDGEVLVDYLVAEDFPEGIERDVFNYLAKNKDARLADVVINFPSFGITTEKASVFNVYAHVDEYMAESPRIPACTSCLKQKYLRVLATVQTLSVPVDNADKRKLEYFEQLSANLKDAITRRENILVDLEGKIRKASA